MMRQIRVAVAVPALEALTYSVPDPLPDPRIGARVLVPLGSRVVTGIVVAPVDPDGQESSAQPNAKDIIDVLDDDAFLPEDVVALALWVADYYACGPGDALAAAMPPRAWVESERHAQITEAGHARMLTERGLRRDLLEQLKEDRPVRVGRLIGKGRAARAALLTLERDGLLAISRPLQGSASAFRTIRVATITAQGLDVHASHAVRAAAHVLGPAKTVDIDVDSPASVRLGQRQAEMLALLAGAADGMNTGELSDRGVTGATVKRLTDLGLVSISRRRIDRDPFGHAVKHAHDRDGRLTLTAEQADALDRLRELFSSGVFAAALLHGVTGSGKTELYLRLAREVMASGRGVLILVPEIALTPAVAGAFHAVFRDGVAIQHSGLSDGERHDQWHRIRRGEVTVVVGTRSAVFAPIRNLGLIVVDEEHDASFKQDESPRYHGRDVAVLRAQRLGALVVLGSATPSLESYHNAENGRYTLIPLLKRVLDRPMATVRLVDMREEYTARGPDAIVSEPLAIAIRTRLERREQSMVLLNRRGFATTVFCRQCGSTFDCPNCSVTLTVHRAAHRARCHYCNYSIKVPTSCAQCAGPYLEQIGFGTERVEAEVQALFPDARVARVDRDTIRRRGAITALLERFAAGEIDVLIGTQMIAKGHDFPQVTLVGVISADVGLGLADFRAGERTFQLLTQVAGRAGRGEVGGEAIVQTIHPDHYSIRHACRQDYQSFYREELNFRRSMRYPPTVALINAVVKGATLEAAMADAADVVGALKGQDKAYRVLGPAQAPLSRLKGEHRAQFFVKGQHRTAMKKAVLAALDARPDIKRRTVVDVDPASVL
jgi:primosomal protein N' (replication factor Y)